MILSCISYINNKSFLFLFVNIFILSVLSYQPVSTCAHSQGVSCFIANVGFVNEDLDDFLEISRWGGNVL